MVKRENGNTFKLGQEVCGRRLTGSDLSPHWLNMVEDGCWYGEGRLIIKKVHKGFQLPILTGYVRGLGASPKREKNEIKTSSGRKTQLIKTKDSLY